MGMINCAPLDKQTDQMAEFEEFFVKHLGHIYGDPHDVPNGGHAREAIKEMSLWYNKKPYDKFYEMTQGDINRLKNEVEREAKKWKGGKISAFSFIAKVPTAILEKTSIGRRWIASLDRAANYESDKHSKFLNWKEDMAKLLRAAGMKAKDVNELEAFEKQASVAFANGDKALAHEYYNKLKKVVGEKDFFGDFIYILEKGDIFKNGKIKREWEAKRENEDGTSRRIDNNIVDAAQTAREILDMGAEVSTNGLNQLLANIKSIAKREGIKVPEKIEKNIKSIIKAIAEQKKNGTYFPHFALGNLPKIMGQMDIYANNKMARNERLNALEEMGSLTMDLSSPTSLKMRSKELKDLYSLNPIGVISRYMSEVISFNKLQHMQGTYMDAVQGLHKMKSSEHMGDYAGSLLKYINHQYITATKGYQERPDWVNKLARFLGAYQSIGKLGIGIATGGRNFASGLFFLSEIGMSQYLKSRKNIRQAAEDSSLKEALTRAEKEQGFLFSQVVSPIFTEGLLPTEGVHSSDIRLNIETRKLEVKTSKGWQKLDTLIDKTVGKTMILQRITENFLRREMFRTTFEQMFSVHANQREWIEQHGIDEAGRIATNQAIAIVGKHAFFYDAHHKAPLIGGTHKKEGAMGQMLMHFMHWPMKFANLQHNIYRNSIQAIEAKQWDSNEIGTGLRFASLFGITALVSAVINNDLTHIVENDTFNRARDLYKFMAADGEEERANVAYGKGPLQSYMGPLLGDLILAGNVMGLYKMPQEEWSKMLLGYKDVDKDPPDETMRRTLSLLNVEAARWITKIGPSIYRGEGFGQVLQHEFSAYPRSWTKKGHKKIFGEDSMKKKKKQEKELSPAEVQMKLLTRDLLNRK